MNRAWIRGVAACLLLAASVCAQADELETAVREAYATNEGLLTQATTSAVAKLFIGFNAPDGASLLVEPAIEHRANWFIETHLLAYLSEAGYSAYLAQPSQQPAEPVPPTGPDSRILPPVASRSPSESLAALVDSTAAVADTARVDTLVASNDKVEDVKQAELATPFIPEQAEGAEPDYVLRYRVVLCELSYPEKYRTSPLGSRKVERRASVSIVAQLMHGPREDVTWVGKGNSQQVSVVPAGKLNYLAGTDFPFNPPALEQKGMGAYVEPMLVTGIVAGLIYLFYANQD